MFIVLLRFGLVIGVVTFCCRKVVAIVVCLLLWASLLVVQSPLLRSSPLPLEPFSNSSEENARAGASYVHYTCSHS